MFLQLFSFISVLSLSSGQTILDADGDASNTYNLIDSVFGKGAEETPDCAHKSFGRHISQTDDSTFGSVFVFYIHVTPDNDRCQKKVKDRQRNEIKIYGPSSSDLKGNEGDTVSLSWDFKLPKNFQATSGFTHIHQIKAGDGDNKDTPIITITPRYNKKSKKQTLQILHVGNDNGKAKPLKEVDLSPFLGEWVHVQEQLTYSSEGSYQLEITRVKDSKSLVSVSEDGIDLWRDGATFIRPKWGIYRKIAVPDKNRLQDEQVLFHRFCLGKGDSQCE